MAIHSDSKQDDSFDLCIVGAGMAGATIAAYLGSKGIKIALIDRDYSEKKRIVGELLQPGAVQSLKKMGLLHLLDGIDAQPVHGYALFRNEHKFSISYNKDDSTDYKGVGLHNGRFLQNIRKAALNNQSVRQFHGTVGNLLEDNNKIVTGIQYKEKYTREIKTIQAKLTITCDGFFSTLRKDLSNNVKTITSFFIGLVLEDCQLPFANYGHVFLSAPTPFICYPISSTETRMLIDFPGDKAPKKAEITAYILNKVMPFLPEEIKACVAKSMEGESYKIMPNHYMPAKPIVRKGAVLLGDALNMRHPLTGGGLTAVFNDVFLLSKHLLEMPDFNDSQLIHDKLSQYYKDRQHANANVNIMANALYGVMSNDLLKKAVFEYLQKGGENAEVPITLLAGLNRNSLTLIKHFFCIYLLCIKMILKENKCNFTKVFRTAKEAFCIFKPLAFNELKISSFTKKHH